MAIVGEIDIRGRRERIQCERRGKGKIIKTKKEDKVLAHQQPSLARIL